MEVTRLNFKEVLPVITQAIEDASFLAIDAEFTGLTTRRRENALDTCEERYEKLIAGVKEFTILQFGVCTFSWDEDREQYIAKPFNFYTFPKPFNRQMPDMRFLCQSSSMDFLAKQGFDFNKWVHHGIPFLLPTGEEKLRRLLESRREENQNEYDLYSNSSKTSNGSKGNMDVTIPPQYEKTIEQIMKKVKDFTDNPGEKSLSLPPSSPLVRKLVYGSVKSAYKTGLYLESKVDEEDKKYIVISKVTEEEKKNLQNARCDKEDEEIELAVGFSKVIRLISLSGKIILGHNMLLDLLHMIRLFVRPLPDELDGFKALVKGSFPRLIDTKVMATTPPLQEHFTLTHLEEMFKKTSEKPFEKPDVVLPDEFERYMEGAKAHEAGYDAYVTGVSFIAMATYLEKLKDGEDSQTQIDLQVVKPFLNKIFLFPRIEDIPYLNLADKDLTPNRDHVFYIEYPDTWQISDVQAVFKAFGYVYVSRLDSTSAFVSVAKRERACKVLDKLDVSGVPYRIMSYNEYHNGLGSDQEDGKECSYYSLNRSCDIPIEKTPNPEQKVLTGEISKEIAPSDDEVEEGEIVDSPEPPKKKSKDRHTSFKTSDSSEPPKKKMKGQHTWFDEPDDW